MGNVYSEMVPFWAEVCYEELRRDLLYDKIPVYVRESICRRAWATGILAASRQADRGQMEEIHRLIEKQNLQIEQAETDQVVGGMRFFGEYVEKQKKIILYSPSVCRFAQDRSIPCALAEELILAHEFYHFLEHACLGRTSEQYTVPSLQWGRLSVGKNGIRALSEIGAYGFSYMYWKLRYGVDEKE